MCDRDRQRIDSQHRQMLRRDAIRILKNMLSKGYTKGTTLGAALQDLENDGAPLSERIGRGFAA